MDYECRVIAKYRGSVRVASNAGLRHTVFVGDRRFSRNNRAYLAARAAKSIMRDIEQHVFGDDCRWFQASTPLKDHWGHVMKIADAIMVKD